MSDSKGLTYNNFNQVLYFKQNKHNFVCAPANELREAAVCLNVSREKKGYY